MELPTDVFSVAQIRELERVSKGELGITEATLMQCAGAAAFGCLQTHWMSPKRIAIVCGAGNNGGDGYVLGRLAFAHGWDVTIWQVGDADALSDVAQNAAQACYDAGIIIEDMENFHDLNIDVIVDAVLGIGVKGDVKGEALTAIAKMNASDVPVLSLDVPSGLNADTGAVMGEAVYAEATITFIGLKQGLLTHEGLDRAGTVYCDSLQVPTMIFDHVPPVAKRFSYDRIKPLFVPRKKDTHKGDYGHVLVIGGDEGFTGAAMMAAESALRVGAGRVTIATRQQHATLLNLSRPEIMCRGVETKDALMPLLEKADVIIVGPGLGLEKWGKMCVAEVLKTKKLKVLDADGLTLLSEHKDFSDENAVLTPHPGEAARLLGVSASEVQHNRLDAVEKLKERYHAVCVLKGAGTLVADHSSIIHLCNEGNPGMASAGMGDVLSGVIAGLLAQGFYIDDAVLAAVAVHARAGDNVADEHGERGLLAMDLVPEIQQLVNV